MAHVKVFSATTYGLDVHLVEVEVSIESMGLPAFNIVGLADKSIEEAKERVRASLKSIGFEFPDRRITVNLAPAELKKKGAGFDLSIAIGILIASQQIKVETSEFIFLGELSLDARIRYVSGVLPTAIFAKEKGYKSIFVPEISGKEASIVADLNVYAVGTLSDVVFHLTKEKLWPSCEFVDITGSLESEGSYELDMADIYGQAFAKRALEICAAGGHNLALFGPPGTGKTMLSKALPSILPSLTFDECLEVTKIYSVAGHLKNFDNPIVFTRPFRSPHHTISLPGLIGGGSLPFPGEISLAHLGVLFIDEFSEMPRHIIEALRQPLEDGIVAIARAQGRVTFPSRFIFISSYNPCPCGYFGDEKNRCKCSPRDVISYQKKLSGPIMDRIDMFVEVSSVKESEVGDNSQAEKSTEIKERVQGARNIQNERYNKVISTRKIRCNADLNSKEVNKFCTPDKEGYNLLKRAMGTFGFSLRGFHKVLKVARTIADLEGGAEMTSTHIAEALQFRVKSG